MGFDLTYMGWKQDAKRFLRKDAEVLI